MVAELTPFPPRPELSGRPRKVFFHTFGCQMNVYDTGKMRVQLARDGFVSTDDPTQVLVR